MAIDQTYPPPPIWFSDKLFLKIYLCLNIFDSMDDNPIHTLEATEFDSS